MVKAILELDKMPEGCWDTNPWVFVIEFKVKEALK